MKRSGKRFGRFLRLFDGEVAYHAKLQGTKAEHAFRTGGEKRGEFHTKQQKAKGSPAPRQDSQRVCLVLLYCPSGLTVCVSSFASQSSFTCRSTNARAHAMAANGCETCSATRPSALERERTAGLEELHRKENTKKAKSPKRETSERGKRKKIRRTHTHTRLRRTTTNKSAERKKKKEGGTLISFPFKQSFRFLAFLLPLRPRQRIVGVFVARAVV